MKTVAVRVPAVCGETFILLGYELRQLERKHGELEAEKFHKALNTLLVGYINGVVAHGKT